MYSSIAIECQTRASYLNCEDCVVHKSCAKRIAVAERKEANTENNTK